MSITKSRVKKGKLTFTGTDGVEVDFSCQPTNVTIGTDYDESGDTVEVLCGDTDVPEVTTSRKLKVTAIQDFDSPEGFQAFLLANEGRVVEFEWLPNADGGPTFSGTVQCRVGDIGGDVASSLTSDLELPISRWDPPQWPNIPKPVFTVAEDKTDTDRKTAKVTITSGGPAAIGFGDTDTADDTVATADGAAVTHKYTETGELTITVSNKGGGTTQTVTIPFTDGTRKAP
ncbi:hypothetical protein [Phytomonospora endophytica]|uniref:Uncharacterized protein n=1 Tax=Phytomonospora endophytica TaxID=714109 RepID=A0A841G0X0_9ACTN|nr:hypothetical protein [Phytomonospora endophytica]MBB6038329.1 hypothetical protein [Phytomonospora endophytica]GIG64259.1 hypothetical protein Pen01_05540 [Phytomonospora endophytica]